MKGNCQGGIIIHRHNDEYITVVFVPGSLVRSSKKFQLGYAMGVPGSLLNFIDIRNSSRKKIASIDAIFETGSSRPLVKSACQLGRDNSACVTLFC